MLISHTLATLIHTVVLGERIRSRLIEDYLLSPTGQREHPAKDSILFPEKQTGDVWIMLINRFWYLKQAFGDPDTLSGR